MSFSLLDELEALEKDVERLDQGTMPSTKEAAPRSSRRRGGGAGRKAPPRTAPSKENDEVESARRPRKRQRRGEEDENEGSALAAVARAVSTAGENRLLAVQKREHALELELEKSTRKNRESASTISSLKDELRRLRARESAAQEERDRAIAQRRREEAEA